MIFQEAFPCVHFRQNEIRPETRIFLLHDRYRQMAERQSAETLPAGGAPRFSGKHRDKERAENRKRRPAEMR